MVGKPIENLRRGEAVAFKLASKIFGYHHHKMPSDSDIILSVTCLHRQAQNM
jgi:hypothetical protein